MFIGVRGNAVLDIPVFWAQRKIPVDLHFIVRLLLRLEDVASVAPSIKVKIPHLSTPPVHAGVAAACPCGRTLRSWNDVFPCGTTVRVVYITVRFLTLLAGQCHFRGCLRSYVLMRRHRFRIFAFQ